MSNILTEKPKVLFNRLLEDYNIIDDINFSDSIRMLKDGSLFETLTNTWYQGLKDNHTDKAYGVYGTKYYFIDLFDCFITYSRRYIKDVAKSDIFYQLKDIRSFVDLGCGLSYSTIGLRDTFPNALAYATNLKNTKQWKFCELMTERNNFRLIRDVGDIGYNVDLVFASEYFEHFVRPMEHLNHILECIKPKYLVIANAFNTRSIGHFETYKHENIEIDQSKISRVFNNHLIDSGYEKLKVKMWNNRPQIWCKVES